MLASSLTLTEAPRALVDERIFEWHQQAAGYKIRYVPASLPDMLKTRALLEWEYAPHLGRTADQAIGASEDRLTWMRSAQSDYEIAMPIYEIDSFAQGMGYYEGLPLDVRLEQIDHLLNLCEQLYPRMRIYLYDANGSMPRRSPFSAPCSACSMRAATTWHFGIGTGSKPSPATLTRWCARPISPPVICPSDYVTCGRRP